MAIGNMRKRFTFQRESRTPNNSGGYAHTWSTVATVWGSFRPERGSERLDRGRLADPVRGTVRVRSSSTTRTITAEDRVTFDSTSYQIRSIINPDQRNRFLEMVVERNVAT
jgi:SPP1 family predicted phage head-tail adaptor